MIYHSKENYLDLDAHYLCELVENGILSLQYCPTEQQAVDIFMKSFTEAMFCASLLLAWNAGSCHQGGIVMTPSFLSVSVDPSPNHY